MVFDPISTPSQVTGLIGEPPVIIVGSGMSGLAAATGLKESGCCSVVLEARDRIGGRTYSLGSNVYTHPSTPSSEAPPADSYAPSPSYRASGNLDPLKGQDIGGHWIEGNSINRNPIKRLVVEMGIPFRKVINPLSSELLL